MKGTDKYLVDIENSFVSDYQISLSQLYTPIAGVNAVAVFNMLVADANKNKVFEINKLLAVSLFDINSFEEAIISLEKCELVSTYCKKDEGLYLFVLHSPLSVNSFFTNDIYGHLFLDKVGQKYYQQIMSSLIRNHIEQDYFENITHGFDNSLVAGWSNNEKEKFKMLKYENPNEEKYIFDIRNFVREIEDALFPIDLRTEENLNSIASLGTTFAIREDDMRHYLHKSIDYKTNSLNVEALRNYCLSARKLNLQLAEDEYDSAPIAFLYNRRGNVTVAKSDKEFLERCLNEYKLKREVVNALIEVVLKNNGGRFVVKYAEKIASDWASLKIDTKEKAFAESESGFKNSSDSKSKNVYTLDEMNVEEIPIEELRKKKFRKG